MSARARIIAGLGAEVSFAILPLLVVAIVLIHQGPLLNLFASPEWSFGAAILLGQALVKFVSGFAKGGRVPTGFFGLAVALLIVFGLVPALVVNAMTVMAMESTNISPEFGGGHPTDASQLGNRQLMWVKRGAPTPGLQISQVLLFGLGILAYILLGTVGEETSAARGEGDLLKELDRRGYPPR